MPERRRAHTVPILLALGVLAIVLRLRTYDEPFERDLTTYAVIGHEWNAGRALYSDLWDHKPPAIHLSYAVAERLAGYGPAAIYLLSITTALATLLGTFVAARAITASETAGVAAAALWTVTGADLALQANQPNTEVFLNALGVWGLAALAGARGRRDVAFAGLAFAAASLYKPNHVVVAASLAVALLATAPRGKRATALADLALYGAIGAAAWLLLGGYFAAAGRFDAFRDAVFTYNRAYASDLAWNLARGLKPTRLAPPAFFTLAPLAAVAILGVVGTLRRRPIARGGALLLGYAAGTYAAVALPGHFFPHYYQLWLPVLAISAAAGLAALAAKLGRPTLEGRAAIALTALLALLQIPTLRLGPEAASERKYGDIFTRSRRAARRIDQLLAPGETFYELGSESGLYYWSGRRPPSGVFYALPIREGPLAARLTARVVSDLERHPPELFIVERSMHQDPSHPLIAWYRGHYRERKSPPDGDGFRYYYRTGGRLDPAE